MIPVFGMTQVCTIDYSQTTPGIYPDTMPTGYVGAAYNEDITFVMPLDTSGFPFLNFHILSIALPVGLTWECNNSASNCDYDPAVSQYGCVNIQGTPLLAGQYQVDVTVIADLSIASGLPSSFSVFLEILPSNVPVSNTGFSMVGATGCFPQTVDFANNNPGLLAYTWDFGNGNYSSAENPSPQIYSTPGDYIVNYQAWDNLDTLDVYTLTNVTIQSMSNYGGGFPAFENPDPYFIIYENAAVYNQSGVYADTFLPVGWNTSILLDPLQSYTIEIWESDAGEIGFGADDFMGSAPLSLSGCIGCAVGTSVIDYTVSYQQILPTPSVISVDTVHVNGYPIAPSVTWDSIPHTVWVNDMGYSYQWYFNGSPIAGATDTSHVVMNSGEYYIVAVNASGCVAFSDTAMAIFCDPAYIPNVQVNGDSNLIVTDPIGDIQWYVNGVAIPNDTLQVCVPGTAGTYHVEVMDDFGCVYASTDQNVTVGFEAISNLDWNIYPNPANNELMVEIESDEVSSIDILDLAGRILISRYLDKKGTNVINLSQIIDGTYIVRVNTNSNSLTKKLIVHK